MIKADFNGHPRPELINERGEEISLSPGIKGIIVLAVPKASSDNIYKSTWVLLIAGVTNSPQTSTDDLCVFRHVSYNLSNGRYSYGGPPSRWGKVKNYDFFIATDKQKEVIKEVIKHHNAKFVKILNRVIRR